MLLAKSAFCVDAVRMLCLKLVHREVGFVVLRAHMNRQKLGLNIIYHVFLFSISFSVRWHWVESNPSCLSFLRISLSEMT